MRIATVCHLLLFFALFACESFKIMLGLAFCFGLLNSIRMNIGYIYMMELLPLKGQAFFGGFWLAFEGVIMLIASFYFLLSENRKWETICLIGFTMQIVAIIGLWFLPESPKFLIE